MISSIGKPLNKLFSLYLKKRMVEIENFMKSPLEVQDQALKKIIYTAKNTEFGLSNSFNYLRTSKEFKNREDYRTYRKYRYYASKVFPYAQKAIKIFREIEESTETMNKRKRKKFVKRKYKQLKKEFKTPLKNLTKTQGKILIKMIEKELDTPFYTLMKDMKGGWTAGYWNQMGKFFNYDLKEGYHEGDDPILDVVINDFDISYKKY